jgi:hypothetical protein
MNTMGTTVRRCSRRCWLRRAVNIGVAAVVVYFCALALSPSIQAAEFSCPSGDEDCLINAINTANNNNFSNTINLLGTDHYILNKPIGAAGLPGIRSNLTIRGGGSDTTIIERNDMAGTTVAPFRIFNVGNLGHLTLIGVKIRGGGCGNENESNLGIICDFNGRGGGILNNGGTVTLTDVEISANTATQGGGIFNEAFGTVIITNSTLSQNVGRGGGLFNSGTVTIINSTLVGNRAPNSRGVSCGGIANVDGLVTITNSTLSGNRANESGGGICNNGEGGVTITNSTLSGNSAEDKFGGGIDNSGAVTITNSTLSGNVAKTHGDSIFNDIVMINGKRLEGTVTITNSIVANNRPLENCVGGTITDRGVNLDSGRTCGFSISDTDPLLDPDGLKNNGGPTKTIAQCTGMGTPSKGCTGLSPAIDIGNNRVCGVAPNNIDQRGFVRPVGGTCDIGAFESGAEPPPVINSSLVNINQRPRTLSPDTTGCPSGQGFVGKSSVNYRLTNKSTSPALYDLMAKVTMLENGNLLQNADGGPGGMGAILTVPKVGQYSDGLLSRGQFVDIPFVICLKDLSSTFLFEVEWRGLTR